jgi:hypothetical protein
MERRQDVSDLRHHRRIPTRLWADLYWESTDRQMRFARAQVLDLSDGGVRLKLASEPPRAGTSINVRIERVGFADFGIVRHATWHGMLGVELRFETATKTQIERWQQIVESAQER